ncbi:hypothetical protein C8F04DRAFT_1107890 [Mycena alexandri]|uniref:BTB/POZ domain-containing protein n=1 Tax=Mycena alexandri TaxID=1745969 RepID=A0AAD6STI1_9AGAR|nr:hypothetical protein C8F04DRAFT_1107890 [Mycena alexandri]
MTLVKIGDDVWTRTAINSTFNILLPDVRKKNARGKGISGVSTVICGLGWRFSCSASTQSSNQSTFSVGPDGGTLPTWRISVFFDPHLIRSASYGLLSFSIDAQHLLEPKDANHSTTLTLPYQDYGPNVHIGTYIYTPGHRMVPTIVITVELPAESGLSIPRSIDRGLERVLADTMGGKPAVDLKFYAFTRKTSGYVTHPQPIFANSTLLKGYSGELDLMIYGGGFREAKLVDLDRHQIDKDHVDDYDYMSDSDLDSDDEEMEDNALDGRAILLDVSEASFFPQEACQVSLPPSEGPSRPASSAGLANAWEASFVTREPCEVPLPASVTGLSDMSEASFLTQASEVAPSHLVRTGRVVILRGTAFKTWQALLYYLYTSKLSLSSASQPLESQSRTPQCSAKSMYRLADKLGLDALKAFSVLSIKADLSLENIIQQVFSKFTSRYPEVQDIEVEFLLDNFPALKGKIDQVLEDLCKGDRPYCADVLRKIVAGRNPSR